MTALAQGSKLLGHNLNTFAHANVQHFDDSYVSQRSSKETNPRVAHSYPQYSPSSSCVHNTEANKRSRRSENVCFGEQVHWRTDLARQMHKKTKKSPVQEHVEIEAFEFEIESALLHEPLGVPVHFDKNDEDDISFIEMSEVASATDDDVPGWEHGCGGNHKTSNYCENKYFRVLKSGWGEDSPPILYGRYLSKLCGPIQDRRPILHAPIDKNCVCALPGTYLGSVSLHPSCYRISTAFSVKFNARIAANGSSLFCEDTEIWHDDIYEFILASRDLGMAGRKKTPSKEELKKSRASTAVPISCRDNHLASPATAVMDVAMKRISRIDEVILPSDLTYEYFESIDYADVSFPDFEMGQIGC